MFESVVLYHPFPMLEALGGSVVFTGNVPPDTTVTWYNGFGKVLLKEKVR